MNNQEIVNYVMHTPGNTNPAILKQMLDGRTVSWNDLKDKPFDETTVKGDTLTWDGNTEGLVSTDDFSEMLGTLYKISDAVPTLEDCISGATYTVAFDGKQENRSIGYDKIAEMSGFMGCLCIVDLNVLIAPENNFQIEVEGVTAIFPEAGLYTAVGGDCILKSLTIPGYNGFETTTIKPIETKYLPEALQFGEEINYSKTLTWDGTESDTIYNIEDIVLHHVSDVVLTKDELRACSFTDNSGDGGACSDVYMFGNAIAFSSKCMIIPEDNFIIFDELEPVAKKGIYFIVQTSGDQKYYITSFTLPESSDKLFCDITVKTIDEKYMPTLTSPSGKKFKLSVDDSGVLSATEVTE